VDCANRKLLPAHPKAAALFVVATPIGNLEDITLRALKVLKEADLIAAEDTRETRKLLSHYGISTPLTSYYEHNEREKAPFLLEKLRGGKNIALASDAGTPAISDPGYRLVKLAAGEGIQVISIPGPSSLTSALSISGLPTSEFTFKGFIPASFSRRKRFFLSLKGEEQTFVMYESPRRLKKTLEDMKEILCDAEIAIARELTKIHEEVIRGTIDEAMETLKEREVRGEVTIVLRTKKSSASETFEETLSSLLSSAIPLKDAVKAVAKEYNLPKTLVYKEALKIKQGMEGLP